MAMASMASGSTEDTKLATVEAVIVMQHTALSGAMTSLIQAKDTGSCWIETKDIDFEAFEFKKLIRRILLQIENVELTQKLFITVKWRNSLSDELNSEEPINLKDLGGIIRMRPPNARFFRIRIYDDAVSVAWRLQSITVFGKVGSKRL